MRDAEARRGLQPPASFTPFTLADCGQTIHRRFERHAKGRPEAVAVALPDKEVTYARLNEAANRAARSLLTVVRPAERPVALMLRQGFESILWTLAILKAGLGYAPLDQRLPAALLHEMLEDLGPGALLVARSHVDLGRTLSAGRFPLVDVEADVHGDARWSPANLDRRDAPDQLAYVFYTSGSTDRPKGVADCHRNVLHNILRYTNTLFFAPEDRLSLVQNPSFSGTVSSLFGALLNGASIAPFDVQGDGLALLSAGVRRAGVTVFHGVPAIFRELADPIDRFPDVRLVRLEGDRVQARDLAHFQSNFQGHCTLVNGLGATECGLVRQFFIGQGTTDRDEAIPVGYDVPDVNVRVEDDSGRELAPELPGEIVVESRFLATGYWNNPQLTADRFESAGGRVRRYRTGDVGLLHADGCLVHLGRIDLRVRIGGEFIDTGHVERVLQSCPGIAQAVVHDFVDRTLEPRLCAYVVREPGALITTELLREALSGHLPHHAIPPAFRFLDALPLTRDLKVDRKRLPVPARERPELGNAYVAPDTLLEKQMAEVWSEVLEVEPVGVTDSLLALGGDSLRAARIVSRLRTVCGDDLRVTTLFEHLTIRALTRAVEG